MRRRPGRLNPAEEKILRRTEPQRYRGYLLTPTLAQDVWYVTRVTVDRYGIPHSERMGQAPTLVAARELVDRIEDAKGDQR